MLMRPFMVGCLTEYVFCDLLLTTEKNFTDLYTSFYLLPDPSLATSSLIQ